MALKATKITDTKGRTEWQILALGVGVFNVIRKSMGWEIRLKLLDGEKFRLINGYWWGKCPVSKQRKQDMKQQADDFLGKGRRILGFHNCMAFCEEYYKRYKKTLSPPLDQK